MLEYTGGRMEKYNFNIDNIERTNRLVGKIVNGILVVNEIEKGLYYGIDREDKCIRIIQGDMIRKCSQQEFKQYGNPWLCMKDRVAIIFTFKAREIKIDSLRLGELQGEVIGGIQGDNNQQEIVIFNGKKKLSKILFGLDSVTHKNGDELDFRIDNIKELSKTVNIGNNVEDNANIFGIMENTKIPIAVIRRIDGIIKKYGYEGDIIDTVQILSKCDSKNYYARRRCAKGIEICKVSEEYLKDGIIIVESTPNKMQGNPHLDLNNGTTIVVTSKGNEILLDTDVYHKYFYGNTLGVREGPNKRDAVYVNRKTGVVTVARELMGLKTASKTVYFKNNNNADLRINNLAVVSKSAYCKEVMRDFIGKGGKVGRDKEDGRGQLGCKKRKDK